MKGGRYKWDLRWRSVGWNVERLDVRTSEE